MTRKDFVAEASLRILCKLTEENSTTMGANSSMATESRKGNVPDIGVIESVRLAKKLADKLELSGEAPWKAI